MTRPRRTTVSLVLDRAQLQAAMRVLKLRSPSDVVEAGLLTLLEWEEGHQPGRTVFFPAYALVGNGLDDVIAAFRSGIAVCLAHKGRLRTYKPGTLRAGRLLRRLEGCKRQRHLTSIESVEDFFVQGKVIARLADKSTLSGIPLDELQQLARAAPRLMLQEELRRMKGLLTWEGNLADSRKDGDV